MYGGTTLKLSKYLNESELFKIEDYMYSNNPELFGMNPKCILYISQNKKNILKYISPINEYDNINHLFKQLYHSEACVLEVNNIGLRLLMESGYYTKLVLLGYEIFGSIRNDTKLNSMVGEELQKQIYNLILNNGKYVEFEKCITQCKEFKHTTDLKNEVSSINEFVTDTKNRMSNIKSMKEKNETLIDIINKTTHLSKGQKKNIIKELRYDGITALYKTLTIDSQMTESAMEELMNTLNRVYEHSEFMTLRYISDLYDMFEHKEKEISSIKKKMMKQVRQEDKFYEYIMDKVTGINEILNQIEDCKIIKYKCENNPDKSFNKGTSNIKYIIKTLTAYIIASHIEMDRNMTLYNPILVNGLLMSYYYDYGTSKYTDENVDDMFKIMKNEIEIEYEEQNRGNHYTIKHKQIVILQAYINSFENYKNIEIPMYLYSDYSRVKYEHNGENIEFTACGEIAILNLMRIFKKKYNILPYTKEMQEIMELSNTETQILKFVKAISNLTNITYYGESEGNYLYNINTTMTNILSCLNYIYVNKKDDNVNFEELLKTLGITKQLDYISYVNDDKTISITFDFGNINLTATFEHAYVWYSTPNSTQEQDLIIDTMTSMIAIFTNISVLNYINHYPILLYTIYYLTIQNQYAFNINFNEEIANVLIDQTKKTDKHERMMELSLEIIKKYGSENTFSLNFTRRLLNHFKSNDEKLSNVLDKIYDCMQFDSRYFYYIIGKVNIELVEKIIKYSNFKNQKIFDSDTLLKAFDTSNVKLINLIINGEINTSDGLYIIPYILNELVFIGSDELIKNILIVLIKYIKEEQSEKIKEIKNIIIDQSVVKYIQNCGITENIENFEYIRTFLNTKLDS